MWIIFRASSSHRNGPDSAVRIRNVMNQTTKMCVWEVLLNFQIIIAANRLKNYARLFCSFHSIALVYLVRCCRHCRCCRHRRRPKRAYFTRICEHLFGGAWDCDPVWKRAGNLQRYIGTAKLHVSQRNEKKLITFWMEVHLSQYFFVIWFN